MITFIVARYKKKQCYVRIRIPCKVKSRSVKMSNIDFQGSHSSLKTLPLWAQTPFSIESKEWPTIHRIGNERGAVDEAMLRLNPERHGKVLEEGVGMQTIYLKGKGRTKRGSRQPLPRDVWLFYYQPLAIQCFSLWKVSSNCEKV